MDKRSWPWKKKASDKFAGPNEGFEPSSSRDPDDHDAISVLRENASFPDEQQKHVSQECERKLKDLAEKLSAALFDVANKDALVKQHAKVAEEAIAGWEKAEAEAVSLRQQLDSLTQHKLAVEDRVVHLDGALKECMSQLRHTREQQEEKIHDAIVKKTSDWDKARAELEEKLEDLEQRYLERDVENKALMRDLEERGKTISQLSEACSKAEAVLNMLRIQLDSSEKERNAFKYELNVIQKELEIRNEEKVLSERAAEAATKQHLEDIKAISKLDAECQRLRGLVRKKLPSPGALAQMRLDINGINKDNKRKTNKIAGSPRAMTIETVQNGQQNEESPWLERYSALEEETKMLREALTKKNNELHSSRVMCARTATKLSSVEQQLDALTNNLGISKIPVQASPDVHLESTRSLSNSMDLSVASASEDGNDGEVSCAESWASALIVELDQFKKTKPAHIPCKVKDSFKSELDEFMEMEHLASLSPLSTEDIPEIRDWEHKGGAGRRKSINITSPVSDRSFKAELKEAGWRYEEVNAKLIAAEEEIAAWKSKNAANQEKLSILRSKFDMLLEAQEASANLGEVLNNIREEMGMRSHSIVSLQKQIKRLSKSSGHDDEAPPKICGDSQECYELVVFEVIKLIEAINTTRCRNSISLKKNENASVGIFDGIEFDKTLDIRCQKLVYVKNEFLHKKADLEQLMAELASVLGLILKQIEEERNGHVKLSSWSRPGHVNGQREYPGAGSPKSDLSEGEDSLTLDERNPNGNREGFLSSGVEKFEIELKRALFEKSGIEEELRKFQSQKIVAEEELRKAISEKVALQTHMRAEFTRLSSIEQELVDLKTERAEKELELAETKEKLEASDAQLKKAEQQIKDLTARLSSVESASQQGEEELRRMTMLKEQLESQLKRSRTELSKLQEKADYVSKEIVAEQKKYLCLEAKCNRLQEQLQEKHTSSCPRCAMANGESEQMDNEQEVAVSAEKLAECQQAILVLGQQLKAIASSKQLNLQSSVPLDQTSPERYGISSNSVAFAGSKNEAVDHSKPEPYVRTMQCVRDRKESWDPQGSIASDVLDSELISLSIQGQATGRKVFGIFGDKMPAHEDYIEAVEQMPSSPEVEPASLKKHILKPSRRKKRSSPRSYSGIDLSKSMNDVASPSEKHGSGFARFFSRTKNSN